MAVEDEAPAESPPPKIGIRANLAQFLLLLGINALVGGMLGEERATLPLLATRGLGVRSYAVLLTYVLVFGVIKAASNAVAGILCDRIGRKPMLVTGWLLALPVPPLLIWGPSWQWIVVAHVFLGASQGFSWTATVIMKTDLAGDRSRGLAMGLNETTGYGAVALVAAVTGLLAGGSGISRAPYALGIAFAGLGLGLSAAFARETSRRGPKAGRAWGPVLRLSVTDRSLAACSQAGLINNLNDGVAWGLFPLLFAAGGLSITSIAALAALYPAVWAIGQLITGHLSDRIGRKPLIVGGMLLQALALALFAAGSGAWWWLAAVLLGAGTAMVYPSLLAAVADHAQPAWRASAIGGYRLWRDLGFAVGAVAAGIAADAVGLRTTIAGVATITGLSGLWVWRWLQAAPGSVYSDAHRKRPQPEGVA